MTTTISLFADITQMLSWAEKRQPWRGLLIDGNPAHLVDIDMLLPDTYEERSRVLSADELRELHQKYSDMADTYTELPPSQKYSGVRPLKKETELALWICLIRWRRLISRFFMCMEVHMTEVYQGS